MHTAPSTPAHLPACLVRAQETLPGTRLLADEGPQQASRSGAGAEQSQRLALERGVVAIAIAGKSREPGGAEGSGSCHCLPVRPSPPLTPTHVPHLRVLLSHWSRGHISSHLRRLRGDALIRAPGSVADVTQK